jgi:hypothetical protein
VPDLYLDPVGGIAGDMLLGALLDLGADVEALRVALATLPLGPHRLEVDEVRRRGFRGRHVRVTVERGEPRHRSLSEILELLAGSTLPDPARERAASVFRRLAEAEARVHGIAVERVHFHEVGAVDAIIDVVGSVLALEELQVQAVTAGVVPLGAGTVVTAHGEIPVPAPATLELLREWPVSFSASPGERCTPTGAALLAALARPCDGETSGRIKGIGIGFGTREDDSGPPNLLRAVLLETPPRTEAIDVLETALDDMSPEWCGHLVDSLLGAGASDVLVDPVQMKKNRPGFRITILADAGRAEPLARILFENSTTLGVRYRRETRWVLPRRIEPVDTPLGTVRLKIAVHPGGREVAAPEFDDCRAIADAKGIPLPEVYRAALSAWEARRTGRGR